MRGKHRFLLLPAAAALASGCSGFPGGSEEVDQASQALSVCEESVPADLFVDGIPAYDQCSASQNAAIYSNNGVDTSTSSLGSDWVRTQWSGGYQCTELAHRYLYFRWDVDWIPNGDAGQWCDSTPPDDSGLIQTSSPVHGDIIVYAPGSCGADSFYGHVAVVDIVDSARSEVTILEQNRAGRRSTAQSCAECFLHATANDGFEGSGGATGTGGAEPATGGALPATGGATGGVGVATGGVGIGTGGAEPTAAGGTTPSTGGRPQQSTGGVAAATGGVSQELTGGAPAVTGGQGPEATGGSTPLTGGAANTAGGSPEPTGGAGVAVGGPPTGAGGAAVAAGGAVNAPGSGGMGAVSASVPATGGARSEDAQPAAAPMVVVTEDDGGCGCRAAGSRGDPSRSAGWLALAGIGLVWPRRRSRRQRSARIRSSG